LVLKLKHKFKNLINIIYKFLLEPSNNFEHKFLQKL